MTAGSFVYLPVWFNTRDVSTTFTRQGELGCCFFIAYLLW
jgi:hypothetical protein